jgi:lipid-binding SYLF domain-containing protein
MKKKYIRNIALGGLFAALSAFQVQAAEEDIHLEAHQTTTSFLNADPSLERFVSDSAGYAVFPNVGKGGFVVGGAHGKGVVYEKSKPVGLATLSQASVGAQVGGQTFAEMIFFQTPAALNDFKSGKFEMSADVSAVVVTAGASKSADYKKGVAVFTLPKKGAMVQASIGGQKFTFQPAAVEPTGRPAPQKNY